MLAALMFLGIVSSHAKTAPSDQISITIPETVIRNTVRSVLPLNFNKIPYLKGDLWIQTINNIEIVQDRMEFEMTVQGRNNKIETYLGKRMLLMDVGNLRAAFRCSASLRYDAKKQILYVTPNIFQDKNKTKTDSISTTVLQLFSLANGLEYPIEMKKIQPFIVDAWGNSFSIHTEITDICLEKDRMMIISRPRITRPDQINKTDKK